MYRLLLVAFYLQLTVNRREKGVSKVRHRPLDHILRGGSSGDSQFSFVVVSKYKWFGFMCCDRSSSCSSLNELLLVVDLGVEFIEVSNEVVAFKWQTWLLVGRILFTDLGI